MAKDHSTIHDIAEALGLTASSVSRALKGNSRISEATRKSVLEQALKMNYRPNTVAAGLRTGKTGIIGVIIPRVNRNFFASIISGIERVVNLSGYNVLICQTGNDIVNEKRAVETLLNARVEGIAISLSGMTKNVDHLKRLKDFNIPFILFDRTYDDLNTNQIVIDDRLGAMLATEHLIEQGCKRIVHIGGFQQITIYKNRAQGYMDALEKHGIAYDENLVFLSDMVEKLGDTAIDTLMEKKIDFDGVFSASDYSAVSALKNLQNRGIRIPEDVAIVGFANEPFTEYITPALTTVNQFPDRIGTSVANLFLEEIAEKTEKSMPKKIILMPELIIRASSSRKIL